MNQKDKIKKYANDYGMTFENATYFINKQNEEIETIKRKCKEAKQKIKKRLKTS